MTQLLNTLRKARTLVAMGWTQNALARNAEGWAVAAYDKDATCWCAEGAITSVCSAGAGPYAGYFPDGAAALSLLRLILQDQLTGDWFPLEVHMWNDEDDRTQEDVLALFDYAIELAKHEV